jgi:hypothetical protein
LIIPYHLFKRWIVTLLLYLVACHLLLLRLSPVYLNRFLVYIQKCFHSLEKVIKRNNPVPADRSYGGLLQRNRSHLNQLPTSMHLRLRAHSSRHLTRMDRALTKASRSLTPHRAPAKVKRRHPSLHRDLRLHPSNDL